MAHKAQRQFFEKVKDEHFELFIGSKVLDCGSLNVNGSFKDLFSSCEYLGIDIVPGLDVDLVTSVNEYKTKHHDGHDPVFPIGYYDVVVSGEMLEHSETWKRDIQDMIDMVRVGGLFAFSCAGRDRPEHGTRRTGNTWGTSPDYYRNLERSDMKPFFDQFETYECLENTIDHDLYFYGIKK